MFRSLEGRSKSVSINIIGILEEEKNEKEYLEK